MLTNRLVGAALCNAVQCQNCLRAIPFLLLVEREIENLFGFAKREAPQQHSYHCMPL